MTAARNANKAAPRPIDWLGGLSVAGMVYCLGIYLSLRSQLTPAMPEPTEAVNLLGASVLPILAAAGIYHLVILFRGFRMMAAMPAGRFLHAGFLVAVILSGLTLATEPVQLSEIGKEYVLFDVEGQWLFLIGSTVFHLAVMAGGFFYARGISGGIRNIDSRSDAFFATMHQVGILCGLLGILGVLSYGQWGVLERYRPFLIIVLSVLALLPWGTVLAFLLIRNWNKPAGAWFDEKQTADTAVGGLCAMMVEMPLLVALGAADWCVGLGQPLPFWLMLVFFVCLIVFSGAVLVRSRMDDSPGCA
ncbi:MAG: hypothetical protein JW929_13135 [Anaerolineales bacterium]|nr:hypothetical protein [Anaerolineales bacterium]